MEKLYKFKIEEFFHWFGDEMALLILESIDIKNPDRLVMIKTKELEGAYNQLNRLTEKVNNQIGDSLYRESFCPHAALRSAQRGLGGPSGRSSVSLGASSADVKIPARMNPPR